MQTHLGQAAAQQLSLQLGLQAQGGLGGLGGLCGVAGFEGSAAAPEGPVQVQGQRPPDPQRRRRGVQACRLQAFEVGTELQRQPALRPAARQQPAAGGLDPAGRLTLGAQLQQQAVDLAFVHAGGSAPGRQVQLAQGQVTGLPAAGLGVVDPHRQTQRLCGPASGLGFQLGVDVAGEGGAGPMVVQALQVKPLQAGLQLRQGRRRAGLDAGLGLQELVVRLQLSKQLEPGQRAAGLQGGLQVVHQGIGHGGRGGRSGAAGAVRQLDLCLHRQRGVGAQAGAAAGLQAGPVQLLQFQPMTAARAGLQMQSGQQVGEGLAAQGVEADALHAQPVDFDRERQDQPGGQPRRQVVVGRALQDHGLGPQQRPAQSQPAVASAVMFQHGGLPAQRLDAQPALPADLPAQPLQRKVTGQCAAQALHLHRGQARQHPGQPPARAGLAAQRPGQQRHRQQGDGQQGQQPAQDRPSGPPGRCGLSRRCSAGSARWRLHQKVSPTVKCRRMRFVRSP